MVRESHRGGFSLIELLVVVAIVTLLAAMILPGLARAREYAYFTSCKNSLRQCGIGVLIYASDNRGRFPEVGKRCTGANDSSGGWRRIGSWPVIEYDSHKGKRFLELVYDDWFEMTGWGPKGMSWENAIDGWYTGRPRQPGKYLPVDVMWDPIVIVRDWCYNWHDVHYDAYAGNDRGRDMASRGVGRAFGYVFFMATAGCAANNPDHISVKWGGNASNIGAQAPFRWATDSRPVTTVHKPSVWLSACITPGNDEMCGGWKRDWYTHFGARRAQAGVFKFNVVHLDGHVDDSMWKSEITASNGAFPYSIPTGEWPYPYGYSHYGWGDGYSCYREPDFDGAFDDNL